MLGTEAIFGAFGFEGRVFGLALAFTLVTFLIAFFMSPDLRVPARRGALRPMLKWRDTELWAIFRAFAISRCVLPAFIMALTRFVTFSSSAGPRRPLLLLFFFLLM